MCFILTHLTDSKGTLVACTDLTSTTSRKVKQFDQSGNHLVLLFRVTQTPISTKTPAEHSLLRIQNQLHTHTPKN